MAFYKHKESNKCISFGTQGAYLRNSPLLLEDCPPNLREEASNSTNYFKIKFGNNNCIHPAPNQTDMLLGSCDGENTKFSKYVSDSNINEDNDRDFVFVNFIFSDKFVSKINLTGKQMINYAFKGKKLDMNKYEVHYKLYNIRHSLKVSKDSHISNIFKNGHLVFTTNISMHYIDKNTGVESEIGPYYFKVQREHGDRGPPKGLVFTDEKSSEGLDIRIYKFPVSKYGDMTMRNTQKVMFNVMIDRKMYNCKYDEFKFPQGLLFNQTHWDFTVFTMLLNDNPERFMFIESTDTRKNLINMRSFQNPSMMISARNGMLSSTEVFNPRVPEYSKPDGFVNFSSNIFTHQDVGKEGFVQTQKYKKDSDYLNLAISVVTKVNNSGTSEANLKDLYELINGINQSFTSKELHKGMTNILINAYYTMNLDLKLQNVQIRYNNTYDTLYKKLYNSNSQLFRYIVEEHYKLYNSLSQMIVRLEDLLRRKYNRIQLLNQSQNSQPGQVKVDITMIDTIQNNDSEKYKHSIVSSLFGKYNALYKNVFDVQKNSIFDMNPVTIRNLSLSSFYTIDNRELESEIRKMEDPLQSIPLQVALLSKLKLFKENKKYLQLANVAYMYNYPQTDSNALAIIVANMKIYLQNIRNFCKNNYGVDYFDLNDSPILNGFDQLYRAINDSTSEERNTFLKIYNIILGSNSQFDQIIGENKPGVRSNITKILKNFNNIYNPSINLMFTTNKIVQQVLREGSPGVKSSNPGSTRIEGFTANRKIGSSFWDLSYANVTNDENSVLNALNNAFTYVPSLRTISPSHVNLVDICANYTCQGSSVPASDVSLGNFISGVESNCNIKNDFPDEGKLELISTIVSGNYEVKLKRTLESGNGISTVETNNLLGLSQIPDSANLAIFEQSHGTSSIGFNHSGKTFTLLQQGDALRSNDNKFILKLKTDGKLGLFVRFSTDMSNNDIQFSKGQHDEKNLGYTYRLQEKIMDSFIDIRKNVYYVNNDGKMYKHDSADISNTGTNMSYVLQAYVKGDPNKPPISNRLLENKDACDVDSQCIGYVDDDEAKYAVYKADFKHLRYDDDTSGNFYMKLKNINSNNFSKSFPKSVMHTLPDYYYRIAGDHYKDNSDIENSTMTAEFKQGPFGLQLIMDSVYTTFKGERELFQTKFNTLVNAFEQLSENEMKMLNQTNIDIKNLNKMINSYDSLMNKATKNEKIKDLVDIQERDTRISHKNSEYSMALAGLLSIGSLMYVFSKVK